MITRATPVRLLFVGVFLLVSASLAVAQDDVGPVATWDIPLVTDRIAENLFLLWVPGAVDGAFVGNIAVLVGEEGALLVDGGLPLVSPILRRRIDELAPGGVRVLINTHPHVDHVGGNDYFRGRGADVLSHENALSIMATADFVELLDRLGAPSLDGDPHLPTTLVAEERVLEWGDEQVRVIPVSPAHSPADLVVYFTNRNVVHMGDLYVDGFPFFDSGRGGSLDGIIGAADLALELLGWSDPGDENVTASPAPPKVVPGHGRLSDARELTRYRDAMVAVRDSVSAMIDRGLSEDEAARSRIVGDLTTSLPSSFARPDLFVRRVFRTMRPPPGPMPRPGAPARQRQGSSR